MRTLRRFKKILPVFLLILQTLFTLAPLTVLIPPVQAQELEPQPIQNDSQLRLDNYSGDFAVYYVVDGKIVAHQGISDGNLDLFLGSVSGEDQIVHNPKRVVVKIEGQTYHLSMQQIENNYDDSDLDLSSFDQDFLFNNWQVDGATAVTKETVRSGVTYTFPLNNRVQVRFNRLPENPSTLTIEEISLSTDLQVELGAVSPVAYDVRTEMADGEFSYDLILPKNETDDEVTVKYAESLAELEQAELITEIVEVEEKTVKVNDLDHMTLFIVVKLDNLGITLPFDGPDDNVGDVWVYRASAGALTSLVTDPTDSVPEQWRTEVVSMNAPGLGRSYLGYRGFSWETVASSNLKEIFWYKYAAQTENDHYLNFFLYKGIEWTSVVIVPNCNLSASWQQCSTSNASITTRRHYLTWGGWRTETRNHASFSDFMDVFADWRFYNDPETDSSLTLVSGSSTTGSDLLNYVDGIHFVYQDDSVDIYNFEAEADLVRPTVTLSSLAPVLTNQPTATIDIKFSEDVNALLANELQITNATVDGLICSDNKHCQVNLKAGNDGLVSMQVPENVVFDNAGFGNEASEDYSYTVDLTTPTATINGAAPKSIYSGNANINVHAIDDNYLKTEFYREGESSPFKTYTGAWFGISWLAEGSYRMVVIDKAGNSTEYVFMIDKTNPTITVKASPDSIGDFTNKLFSKVSFKLYDQYQIDKITLNGVEKDLGNNNWSDLNDVGVHNGFGEVEGSNTLVAYDVAGNNTSYNFVLDRIAPEAPTLISPQNNAIVQGSILTSDWSDVADADYYIYESYHDELATNLRSHAEYTESQQTTTNVADTVFWWRVKAVDAAGNESDWSELWKLSIDNTSPTITFDSPTNGSVITGDINLQATCNENCDYINFWWRAEGEAFDASSKRYHYEYDNGTQFNWTLDSLNAEKWDGSTYTMIDGNYYFYAAGKDLAGNWAKTSEVMITIDNTSPVGSIDSIYYSGANKSKDYFVTNDNKPVFEGTCSDNNGLQEVTLEVADQEQSINCESDNTWRSEPVSSALADGNYTISLTLTDLAGNETVKTQSLTIDTVTPNASHDYYKNASVLSDNSEVYVQNTSQLAFTG